MTDSLPEPPELDPAALAASEFTRARRGLESTEVRAALGRAADALRTWEERDTRLRERIVELERTPRRVPRARRAADRDRAR